VQRQQSPDARTASASLQLPKAATPHFAAHTCHSDVVLNWLAAKKCTHKKKSFKWREATQETPREGKPSKTNHCLTGYNL